MSDFQTVINAMMGSVQHFYDMTAQNAPYLLYTLYAMVAGFFLYLIFRFISRL